MPKYQVKSPDGRTFEVNAPEGANQDQVLAYAQQHYARGVSPQDAAAMTHGDAAPPMAPRRQASDKIADVVQGDAAEQIPSIYDSQFDTDAGWGDLTGVRPSLAALFGTDANVMRSVLNATPGAKQSQDANGNPVVELPNGKRYYINQPGLDINDVGRGLGKAASFIPAALAGGAPLTLGARLLTGGLASGGTDAAMQGIASGAAGNLEFDPVQSTIAAATGGLAEAAPAAVGALSRGVRSLASSDASLATAGRRIAQEANIPGTLSDEQAIALGRHASEIKGGANPNAILAETEFGFNLTRGQKTGNVRQLRREEMLRNLGGESGAAKQATAVYDSQRANVGEQARKIQDFLAGGQAQRSPAEAAETVMGSAQRQAGELNDRIGATYANARAQRAAVNTEAALDLPGRLRQATQDFDVHPDITPAAKRTIDSITDAVGAIPPDAKGVTLRAIEVQRKRINNAIGGAANATDKAALSRVKSAFDGWLDDAFDNALITGDADALETLKQARALRNEYGNRFQPRSANDQGGKVVQKLLDADATPDQMATAIFGAGEVAPRATASIARKLKAAIGDDKEAWDAVRSGVIGKALIGKAGEPLAPGNMVRNLNILMRDRPTLMKELYSPDEIAKLQRFGKAMGVLMPKGAMAKSSGTAERALAYFNELLSGIPGGRAMINLLSAPRRSATAATMMSPVRPGVPRWQPAVASGATNMANQTDLVGQFRRAGADENTANE